MHDKNLRILLAKRPTGSPTAGDFSIVSEAIPTPGPGEILVQSLYLSLDPYMRGRMNAAKSYVPPVEIGAVMGGGVVGRVMRSDVAAYPAGTIVEGLLGWQQFAVAKPKMLRKIDPALAPISTALGVLGMPGLTAYFGLLDLGKPIATDTVVVSAASGAVGSLVGQIAKRLGCRTVGVVGSPEKARYIVDELGYDAAINYRTSDNLRRDIREAAPDGVNVYFDNVGGPVTDAVFENLAQRARIVICGQISQYNSTKQEMGPRNLSRILTTRSRIEGFIVFDYADRYPQGLKDLATWVANGEIKYKEDIIQGLENAPAAFIGLLEGKNFGKLLVKIAD
ncbi:MAG: NADP-dependent oxidoreductase [Alphaproteobacteria bacterium]